MLLRFSFLFSLISTPIMSKVMPFIPKAPIKSLRAFDEKNDSTIIQNSQNELVFYKGSKSKILFKKSSFQNFQIIYNNFEYLLIEKDSTYSHEFNLRKIKDYYIMKPDGSGLSLIGRGAYGDIHWNGSIVSLVDPIQKVISFYSTQSKSLLRRVSFSRGSNLFFTPKVFMRPSGDIFFTQITTKNKHELIFINKEKKRSSVYRSKNTNLKISFCFNLDNEIRIQLSKMENDNNVKSYILNENLKTIYSTYGNISGEIICRKNEVLLIQENIENASLPNYQLLSIKPNSKEVNELFQSKSLVEIFEHKRDIFLINANKHFKVL